MIMILIIRDEHPVYPVGEKSRDVDGMGWGQPNKSRVPNYERGVR
jgi:hypothetical protein